MDPIELVVTCPRCKTRLLTLIDVFYDAGTPGTRWDPPAPGGLMYDVPDCDCGLMEEEMTDAEWDALHAEAHQLFHKLFPEEPEEDLSWLDAIQFEDDPGMGERF